MQVFLGPQHAKEEEVKLFGCKLVWELRAIDLIAPSQRPQARCVHYSMEVPLFKGHMTLPAAACSR